MQEEIERQKAALLGKPRRKETIDVSGNVCLVNDHSLRASFIQMIEAATIEEPKQQIQKSLQQN